MQRCRLAAGFRDSQRDSRTAALVVGAGVLGPPGGQAFCSRNNRRRGARSVTRTCWSTPKRFAFAPATPHLLGMPLAANPDQRQPRARSSQSGSQGAMDGLSCMTPILGVIECEVFGPRLSDRTGAPGSSLESSSRRRGIGVGVLENAGVGRGATAWGRAEERRGRGGPHGPCPHLAHSGMRLRGRLSSADAPE